MKKIKKLCTLCILTAMILSVAGCGSNDNKTTNEVSSNAIVSDNVDNSKTDETFSSDTVSENSDETQSSVSSEEEPSVQESSEEEPSIEESSKEESSEVQSSADESSVLNDVVTPSFKEAMDSYEAFFDEYVEFMKKYSESDDTMSMLADYADYMTKYTETMKKIDEIDEDELSDADLAYYIEVQARITKNFLRLSINRNFYISIKNGLMSVYSGIEPSFYLLIFVMCFDIIFREII